MDANRMRYTEERHMHRVYDALEDDRRDAERLLQKKQQNVELGAYEDQDAHFVRGEVSAAIREKNSKEILVAKLKNNPYYVHVEATIDDEGDPEHYYLSNNEALDEAVDISQDGVLLPFIKDDRRPIISALFNLVQNVSKGVTTYINNNGNNSVVRAKYVCEDKIKARKLLEYNLIFPLEGVDETVFDELLSKRLEENRNDPVLKNIIATLQRLQFEIVDLPIGQSFVVQGCAGSGKSQCLFHRLFYLRMKLSDIGWNKVVLITPTKLFRDYSSELMRRFKLTSVKNCSIAELYYQILNEYDDRFKYRQYAVELTEEYLPDAYLKQAYSDQTINGLKTEIRNAINQRLAVVAASCGLNVPTSITNEYLQNLEVILNNKIEVFDKRIQATKNDKIYNELVEKLGQTQKQRTKILREIDKKSGAIAKEIETLYKIDALNDEVVEALEETRIWEEQRNDKIEHARGKLSNTRKEIEQKGKEIGYEVLQKYAMELSELDDLLYGNSFKLDEETKEFLYEYCESKKVELNDLLGGLTIEKAKNKIENKISKTKEEESQLNDQELILSNEIDEIRKVIQLRLKELKISDQYSVEEEEKVRKARNILSRLESDIFEKEVWNYLAPIKEKYGVETIRVNATIDGQKEIKILYKSDLLFYLFIYNMLHPNHILPDYKMFCIDEGQDLHSVDYDMLGQLYPKAIFNIFGDVNQVLHEECGIQNWETQTGISTILELNKNYRNNASIVEFCNNKFGSNMSGVGKPQFDRKPTIVTNIFDAFDTIKKDKRSIIIVKDRDVYEKLCKNRVLDESQVKFIDTKAENILKDKIGCYSVFAAKGLEFNTVLVCAEGMTKNQKVVACTRAMENLYYYE